MIILRFLKYFWVWAAQNINWIQMMYLVREGVDQFTPAHVRWSVELKIKDKPAETEKEKLFALKNHSLVLKDLTMLNPDQIVYYSSDPKKSEDCLEKIRLDLDQMPCHEFYDRWVVNPNFDFLITEDDRMSFGGR